MLQFGVTLNRAAKARTWPHVKRTGAFDCNRTAICPAMVRVLTVGFPPQPFADGPLGLSFADHTAIWR
jgi:hypothetical protein